MSHAFLQVVEMMWLNRTTFLNLVICTLLTLLFAPGCAVRGEHAWCTIQHPGRDTSRRCHSSWWWPDHPNCSPCDLRQCAHRCPKAYGARLPC